MCIFSGPVVDVSRTQMFARAAAGGSQFLVYQMKYGSVAENAMILPVPIRQPARDDSLRFIDLKAYPKFFTDLDQGFPYRAPFIAIGCAEPGPKVSARAQLEVHKIGNYIASFVPTLADFTRLDPPLHASARNLGAAAAIQRLRIRRLSTRGRFAHIASDGF